MPEVSGIPDSPGTCCRADGNAWCRRAAFCWFVHRRTGSLRTLLPISGPRV